MDEIWRKIPNIPETYEVSSLGMVRTWNYPYRNWGRLRDVPVEKKVTVGTKGYRQVTFLIKGRKRHFRVSHLVLLAFDGPRPEGYEASHLDGNKLRDIPENLLWETGEDNRSREEVKPHPRNHPKRKWPKIVKLKVKKRGMRESQLRRIVLGLCVRCGSPRSLYAQVCDACHDKHAKPLRWSPGSRGRIPLAYQAILPEIYVTQEKP